MGKKRLIHLQEEVQKGGDIQDERCTVLTHSSLSCLVKGDFVFLCVRMRFSLFACLYTSEVPAWWAKLEQMEVWRVFVAFFTQQVV